MNISTTEKQGSKLRVSNIKSKAIYYLLSAGLLTVLSCEAIARDHDLDLDKVAKVATEPLVKFVHDHWGKFFLASGVLSLIVFNDGRKARIKDIKRKTSEGSQVAEKEKD